MRKRPRCERLLEADVTEAQKQAAARTPDCLVYLLAAAQERLQSEPDAAIRRAQIAADLAERRQDARSAALAWRLIGQGHRIQSRHADANTALLTAWKYAADAGDERLAAQCHTGRIDSLGWLGRFHEAHALALRLEDTFRALNLPGEIAGVLINRGALYYRRDQYAAAITCNERAIALLEQAGDPVRLAKVQSNLAAVFMELHRGAEAAALFERARTSFLAAAMPLAVAMVDANVGFLHYLSGRYALCIAAFQRAQQAFTHQDLLLEAAKCDADMAEAYRELNLHPEAIAAYTRAIESPEHLPLDYERARAEMGRATVWLSTGRTAEARAGLERAAALFRRQRNTTQRARVRLLLAQMLRADGQTDAARMEVRRAAGSLRRSGLRGWAAEARLLLAEMDIEAGRDVSIALYAICLAARHTGRGWLECRAERALAQHYTRRGKIVPALRHLRMSVQALEGARTLIAPESMHLAFLRDKLPVYEEAVTMLLARGRPQDIAEALEYVERAKSRLLLERLESSLAGRFAPGEVAPPMQARLDRIRAELSQGYFRLNALDAGEARRVGTTDTADRKALEVLEREYRDALQQAESDANTSAALPALPPVVPAATLQSALRDREALLEYYITGETVCAWIITPDALHVVPDVARVEEVTYAARRWRYQLQQVHWGGDFAVRQAARFQSGAEDALRSLYDLLLRPLADYLTADSLIVVPHGLLHGLPFHAFYDGDAPALERWDFLTAPSAALWHTRACRRPAAPGAKKAGALPANLYAAIPADDARAAEKAETNAALETGRANANAAPEAKIPPGKTALLMGIATPELPHVAEELQGIDGIVSNATVLQGEAATLAAFRAHAPHCRLLHLATHALYREDNPLFSGLQCADGWLLARDLYGMKLHCELAVLSACQTGVAFVEPGEELFGLVRGFLAAGAHTVAASLWPADDRATACLMERFYTYWQAGFPKAAALRMAQQATRRRFPHPYHWAAFLLVGAN